MERIGIRILICNLLCSILIFGPAARAQVSLPTDFTVEGRLFDKNTGLPLNTNTTITLQLLDKDSGCVLYAEDHTGVVLGSTSGNADGMFALRLGTGVRTFPGAPVNMAVLFSNTLPLVGDGSIVPACSTVNPGTHRSVRVIVGSETLSPDTVLTSTPTATLAGTAETLRGLAPDDFVKINSGQGVTQSNVENVFGPTNYAKLLSLLAGNYVSNTPAANVDLNYHNITNLSAPTLAGDAVNKAYSDATIGGQSVDMTGVGVGVGGGSTLVWNAGTGKWVIGNGAGISLIGAGNGLTGGPITTIGSLSVDTGTTAGKILQLTGSAQIPAVDGHLVTNVNAAHLQSRAVSNTAPSSGQVLTWNATTSIWEPGNAAATGITSLTGDVSASGSGSVATTINNGVVTNAKIADDAVTTAKINSGATAANQLLVTDSVTGTTIGFMTCAVGEILQWSASGWGCVNMSSALGPSGATAATYGSSTQVPTIAVDTQGRITSASSTNINFPVTTVAGRTGAVTLVASDISGLGTAALEAVGTSAGNVVKLDGSAKLPAVDGSQLTSVNASTLAGRAVATTLPAGGTILTWNSVEAQWQALPAPSGNPGTVTLVSAGTGLQGGNISSAGTLSVDVGLTAGKILQLTGSAQIPAVDGYLVSNVNAANLQGRAVSSTAPTNGQVLTWNSTTTRWQSQTIPSVAAAGSDGEIQFNSSGAFASSNKLFWDSTNKRLAIGKNTPGYPLDVFHAATSLGGDASIVNLLDVQAATGNGEYYGTYSETVYNTPGGNLTQSLQYSNLVGILGTAQVQNGSPASAAGVIGSTRNSSTDTLTTGRGVDARVLAVNGDITSAFGVSSKISTSGATGITDAYGLYTVVNGTNITNGYGLYISGVDGSSKSYGIYQSGGAKNYFASNVGINTTNPQANLDVNGTMHVTTICDSAGGNCKNISGGWGPSGTLTSLTGGTGLLGGTITSTGTLNVDVGTSANKILQLTPGAQVPAVDGNLLTNITAVKLQSRDVSATAPTAGQILMFNTSGSKWEPSNILYVSSVVAGTGLLGGTITTNGTLKVDVGTTANKILQLDSNAQIPAVDGYLMANVNAAKLQSRDIASTAPANSQVLSWNSSGSIWEPRSITTSFPLQGPSGSAAAPTYALTAADTGIYGSGSSNVSVAIDGNQYVSLGTTSAAMNFPVVSQTANNGTSYAATGGTPRPALAEYVGRNVSSITGSGFQYSMSAKNGSGLEQDAYIGIVSVTGAGTYTPNIVIGQRTGANSYSERIRILGNGNMGLNVTAPTATLHLRAGTATANSAPIKLTSGTLLSTTEQGAIEYDGTNLYYTDSTSTRRTLANTGAGSVSTGAMNQLAYYNSAGSTVSGLASANSSVLVTSAGGAPQWSALTNDNFIQYALLGGRSGGQSFIGGTAASDSLTLESTSHATKGNVLLNPNGGNVGVGTPTPGAQLDVLGTMRVTTICDNAGANCKTVNGGWTSGTLTSVTAGTGLLGGTVTTTGTFNVDVGTTSFKILQLDNNAQIPAVDGNLVTNVNAVKLQARNIASIAPSSNQVLAWNSINSYWEPQSTLAGFPLQAPDSTASTPTYSFSGAPTTGFYRASNTVGLAISGTTFLGFNTSSAAFSFPTVYQSGSFGTVYAPTGATVRPSGMEHLGVNAAASTGSSYLYSMSVKNSSSRAQNAYIGATSIGGGGYIPAIVFGQQTNTSTYAERMRISESGNVGIGTDAPVANLEIKASSGSTVSFAATNNDWSPGVSGSGIEFDTASPTGNTASVIRSFNQGGATAGYLLINPSGGYVGINTTNPGSELDVNGTLRATQICDSSGGNCKTVSSGWGGTGTVTSVSAGTGLSGGTITAGGTISVDVGTTSFKIVQMDSSGRLPAVDGSNLSNLNADRLRGRQVKNTTPTNGQVLTWNTSGTMWDFSSPSQDLPLTGGTITGTLSVLGNVTLSGTVQVLQTNIINVAATTFVINATHASHIINYGHTSDGTVTLPQLSTVQQGYQVTISRSVPNAVSIEPNGSDLGSAFANSIATYEMRGNNAASVTFSKVNNKWVITGKADDCTIGLACWGPNNIYIGTYNGHQYFTTPADQGPMVWNSVDFTSGGTSQVDGAANTAAATGNANATAVNSCDDLTLGGFTDWYLPAFRELEFLARSGVPGYQYGQSHWSSTETNLSTAWYLSSALPSSAGDKDTLSAIVRCVRKY